MSQNIRKFFELARRGDLPVALTGLVLARIEQEKKRRARRELMIFGLADIFSFSGLVASCFYLANLLAGSGFYNYLSLLWSDGGAVAPYSSELFLSLVDSLPWLGLTIFLAVVLVLILSLAKTLANLKLTNYQFNLAP